MEVVNLTPGKRPRITVVAYGPSRAGKTRWAATFPRPLFLSDAAESGWETIRYMPSSEFYEPDHKTPSGSPVEVWPIRSAAEFMEHLQNAEEVLRKTPNRWQTIVIDSLTFYADTYFAALEGKAYQGAKAGKLPDMRQVYQQLASHLRFAMLRTHEIPNVNVVWLCLDKPADAEGKNAGILLAGQAALKTPARCDALFYHRSYRSGADTVYEQHTRPFGDFMAGGRGMDMLPAVIENPNYRILEEKLGIIQRAAPRVEEGGNNKTLNA